MTPPKKPKQIQGNENADPETDNLEDDKQKPEMDMGSFAQSFKQLSDMFDRMNSTNTQAFKQMNDRNDSVHKALIQFTEKVDRQEATVRALQAKVFGT